MMRTLAATRAGIVNYRLRLAQWLPAILLAYLILVWQLLYARNGVTADLTTGAMPEQQSNLLNHLFFPAFAGISLLILIAERRQLSRFSISGLALVGGFFGYLCLTAIWALAPSVTVSKLILFFLQNCALLVAVLATRRVDDIIGPLFWVLAATLLVNAVAVVLIPATPIGFAGIYSHKNMLGGVAAIGGLFGLYGLVRPQRAVRLVGLAMVLVAVVLLYLSQSKTALGLFILAPPLALMTVIAKRYLRIALPVLLVLITIPSAFVLSGELPGYSLSTVSRVISSDGTFTGRTEVWAFATEEIAKRPLQGYGYQSFWGNDASPAQKLAQDFVQRTPHAHNGYLDLLLQGGAIALVLFLLVLLMTARWIDRFNATDPGLGLFVTTLFLFLLLENLLETDWLQGLSGPSMLTTLLILLAAVSRDGKPLR